MNRSTRMTSTAAKDVGERKARRSRALATLAITAGVAPVTVTGATSAQAATPAFEIFYGQNCAGGQTSSRVYTGYNPGEGWVNDKFETSGWGTTGRGSLIRNNAASIYVSHARVQIYADGGHSVAWDRSAGATCFNLPTGVANHNTNWRAFSYSG